MKTLIFLILSLFLIFIAESAKSQSFTVEINQPAAIVADAGIDIVLSLGNSVSIGAAEPAQLGYGSYNYEWTPALWLDDPTSPNPIATPLDTITYTLRVFDDYDCVAEDQMTIFVTAASIDSYRVEEGIFYWTGDNATSTNESGFSARAGGYRATTGYFYSMRDLTTWWTSNLITDGVANSRTIWYHDNDFDYVTSNSTGNGYSVRCLKDGASPVFKPLVETVPAFEISGSTAISGGLIKNDGYGSISDKGLVWSSSQYPTIESNEGQVSAGSGSSDFEIEISGLTIGNVYWYRAYAVNESGTSYGKMIGITAGETLQPCPDMPVLT
ncbi:MAG: FISUMP domain-containing protein, partial [Bacteroidales bacterium]|nr:FISUMP domain-containing protein [Bacteroidales bacterium]